VRAFLTETVRAGTVGPVKRALLISAVGIGLALAGCGESDEEKAKADVCDARAEIEKNVGELQDLTLGTATVDQVESNVNAIRDELAKMTDAQDQLDDTRKQQVQEATEAFKSQLDAIADDLGKSQSLENAAVQLKGDIANLATAYEESLAPIDCS
jgi:hypothetical protein